MESLLQEYREVVEDKVQSVLDDCSEQELSGVRPYLKDFSMRAVPKVESTSSTPEVRW